MKVEPIAPFLGPLERSVTVPKSPADAFRIFTVGIATWWPLSKFSVSHGKAKTAKTCAFEPFVGGEIYEVDENGTRCAWGRVVAWNPPSRVAFTWHPGGEPAEAQDIEVTFRNDGKATRVTLVHSGWQRLGEKGASAREGYGEGWGFVLGEAYATACA
ncbi:MAG: SRPBCC family protein [Thermoanaerobaculia bacterium]|nr:SRPBCC family protein [Thermoanaerobaculia bacterium]